MNYDWIVPIAFLIDLALGDPYWLPHPVRWMGWGIARYESFIRRKEYPLKATGFVLALGLSAGVWSIVQATWIALDHLNKTTAWIFELWFVYQCISVRGLIDEPRKVYCALLDGDLPKARSALSKIVGRDTEDLDETEISRAAVETIAEGFVDGVASPLLFAAVGGAPLALAFKAVSTLDSMVGYKNERYADFGRASAKLDDWANWIPARLALGVIPLASFLIGCKALDALRIGLRDRRKHPSPNAAHTEATFAGALGVRLGGSARYSGRTSVKSILNPQGNAPRKEHILQAQTLLLSASFLFVFLIAWIRLSFS